jgi:hypothetical protein
MAYKQKRQDIPNGTAVDRVGGPTGTFACHAAKIAYNARHSLLPAGS